MILAAAIRFDGTVWALPAPARHHDVIHRMFDAKGVARVPGRAEQGFIDSEAGFVSRERARDIAVREGQVVCPDHDRELFSEDLW